MELTLWPEIGLTLAGLFGGVMGGDDAHALKTAMAATRMRRTPYFME
jgi:hypothetical protein